MKADQKVPRNIDEYIAGFAFESRAILEMIRMTIRETVPDAEERISYQIPAFYLMGNLVSFAAWKNHIGFYPGRAAIEEFRQELSTYDVSKGAVQFPLTKTIPYKLIRRIVKFRVKANSNKTEARAKTKKHPGSSKGGQV